MPRGTPVFSRALTGLVTGALLITTLQFSSVAATAAEAPGESDFDPVAAAEAARDALPVPFATPADVPQDRAVREDVRATAESAEVDGTKSEARIGPQTLAPTDTSQASSELVADGATVQGTVTDSAGTSVAGVVVSLSGYADAAPWEAVAHHEVQTGADGTWQIAGVDPVADYWYVEFSDPQGRFAVQYWNGLSAYYVPTPIELTEGAVVESIDATLYAPGRITGTVSGGHAGYSEPWIFADLFVYDSEIEGWVVADWLQTGGDGAFSFDLSPDYYAIGATYVSERGVGYAVSDVIWLDEAAQVDLDLVVDRDVIGPDRDFSGDWATDVLAITSTGAMRMYRGDGWGGWVGSSQIGSGWAGMNTVFHAGDFSGDGHGDVIARDGSGNLFLYRGNGAGGWAGAAKVGTGWGGFTSIFAPGDFDGDGNVDVMARDKAGALHLYRGDGAGGWLTRVTVGSGWQGFNTLIGAGDFDGDYRPDVITRDSAGRLFLFPGNGSGGWLAKRQIGSGWQNFTALVGAGDLWGGDWFPDLLVRDVYGRLIVYAGDGTGGWIGPGQVGQGWNGLRIVG
jgi:hypothetical protein